jgi:hypothetical protein
MQAQEAGPGTGIAAPTSTLSLSDALQLKVDTLLRLCIHHSDKLRCGDIVLQAVTGALRLGMARDGPGAHTLLSSVLTVGILVWKVSVLPVDMGVAHRFVTQLLHGCTHVLDVADSGQRALGVQVFTAVLGLMEGSTLPDRPDVMLPILAATIQKPWMQLATEDVEASVVLHVGLRALNCPFILQVVNQRDVLLPWIQQAKHLCEARPCVGTINLHALWARLIGDDGPATHDRDLLKYLVPLCAVASTVDATSVPMMTTFTTTTTFV